VTSISSVVASQMPGYVSYALLRVLIGAGSEGWLENILVFVIESYDSSIQ
jgi:hypothetical protein